MQNITKMNSTAYRIAVGIAVVAALLLVWFNAAVAESDDSPGPMFFGVAWGAKNIPA